jgi:hypothetical protein
VSKEWVMHQGTAQHGSATTLEQGCFHGDSKKGCPLPRSITVSYWGALGGGESSVGKWKPRCNSCVSLLFLR